MTNSTEPKLVNQKLIAILEGHGLACTMEDDWIIPQGRLPALTAIWFPRNENGVLQIEVLVEKDKTIIECFAGAGSGEEAINDGFKRFCINSLHVFLAAFWSREDNEQITKETWDIQGRSYTAYIGNFGTMGSMGIQPSVPEGFFESIERTVKASVLTESLYWIRHYFGQVNSQQTLECLLNNEVWAEGLQSMRAQPWTSRIP